MDYKAPERSAHLREAAQREAELADDVQINSHSLLRGAARQHSGRRARAAWAAEQAAGREQVRTGGSTTSRQAARERAAAAHAMRRQPAGSCQRASKSSSWLTHQHAGALHLDRHLLASLEPAAVHLRSRQYSAMPRRREPTCRHTCWRRACARNPSQPCIPISLPPPRCSHLAQAGSGDGLWREVCINFIPGRAQLVANHLRAVNCSTQHGGQQGEQPITDAVEGVCKQLEGMCGRGTASHAPPLPTRRAPASPRCCQSSAPCRTASAARSLRRG